MTRIYKPSKKEKEAQVSETERKQKEEELFAQAEQFLNENPMRYSQTQDAFLMLINGEWKFMRPRSMRSRFVAFTDYDFTQAVSILMEDKGWKYADVTYTYRITPPNIFNCVSRENWVQPITPITSETNDHHWYFDVLMRSLGCGKKENIEHLEHVICYKYLHPDSFMLPCILIHGEGGVGKDLLVGVVLYTLFGEQTISATSASFLGSFNSLWKGRAAILINEQLPDAEEARKLRDLLHKERHPCNEKYITPYLTDNLALYFISSNNPEGGFLLDRSNADRRISVLRCDPGKTLAWWVAQECKWDEEKAHDWLMEFGDPIFRDRTEVGKWLGYLIAKHGDKKMPKALHGADFINLMGAQIQVHERIIAATFSDPDFTHIERAVLYQGYVLEIERLSQRRYKISDIRFNRRIDAFLKEKGIEIGLVEHQMRQRHYDTTKGYTNKPRRRWFWKRKDFNLLPNNADNRVDYIGEANFKEFWIGPEL